MPAASKGQIELATGSEGAHKARGKAMEALGAGDPVVVTNDAVDTRFDFAVRKATAGYVDGVVLDRKVNANEQVDIVIRGEIEGFIGLTPGTFLSVAAGALDTTAPAEGVPLQFRAVTPSRVIKLW